MRQFFTTLNSVIAAVLLFSSTSLTMIGHGVTTPRAASPAASVSQTIGISRVTIEYSRPAVKERDVYGTNLVHYGYQNLGFGTSDAAPWRAGANENTIITFSDDATVEGQQIPAGTYGLFMALNDDGTADITFYESTAECQGQLHKEL
jgi:hypothetical protein